MTYSAIVAQRQAQAMCRRDGLELHTVTATNPQTGRTFSQSHSPHDARVFTAELRFNGFLDVEVVA